MEAATLTWPDYVMILVMMCISVSIGVYYKFSGNRQKTTAEYFTASKSMRTLPVGIALMVSFVSAIALLGLASDAYSHGTMFLIAYIPFLLVVPLVCYSYFPVFHKLQVTSVYEYLDKRFGTTARLTTSWVNWIQLLLYSGVCLYAPALALEITTGLSKVWSITVLGVVCSFYSSIGGMKAVLMTDVYQSVLMVAAVLMIIITAAIDVGGLGEIWRIADEGGRIEFDNVSLDPTERHTWWSLMIGGLVTLLSMNGVNQVQVQRLMSVKSLSSARLAMLINMVLYIVFGCLTCFAGLAIFSKYHDCDPKATGRITSYDQLMPLYVIDTLAHLPGLPGLFISGIFSAALSTISAALNSLAAMTLEDYIKPVYKKCSGNSCSESSQMLMGKLLACSYGLLSIGIAFSAQVISSVLQTSLTINGSIGGTVLGIFTLGMLNESANEPGAVFGLLTTLAVVMWISFGSPRPEPVVMSVFTDGCQSNVTTQVFQNYLHGVSSVDGMLREAEEGKEDNKSLEDSAYFYPYRISYMWYSVIGFVGSYVLGLAASWLYRCFVTDHDEKKQLDPDLFFPMVAKRIRRRRLL